MKEIDDNINELNGIKSNEDKIKRSFWVAIDISGIKPPKEYISNMRGWPIRLAFETLCNKLMPYAKEKEIRKKVEESYTVFVNFMKCLDAQIPSDVVIL